MGTEAPPGKIACPHCQGLIKAPPLPAGSAVNCPKCGKEFKLGQASAGAVESRKSKVENQGSRERDVETAQRPVRMASPPVPVPPPPPAPAARRASQHPAPPPPPAAAASPNPQSQIPKPKSGKPDTLVDPNLLPPPPPRQKEKPKEVAVVCYLCGTRMYAPLERIGQEVKCPDCHTRNVVPPLKDDTPAKRGGPTLEGAEDFGMSEVVERPKYRPMVTARGEYETISAADPAAMERRLTLPGERPRRPKSAAPEVEPSDSQEIVLAPAVEVVEAARDPRTVLPNPQLEPEDPLYDGKYDDGIIGDFVDPRTPDAWKKAPLVYGIVEFLFIPSTILRWVMFSAGLAIVAGLVSMGIASYQEGGVLVLLIMWGGIPAIAIWLFSFTAAMHTVVLSTGNGEEEVAWPDWNVFEWFVGAMYILIALIASIVPGGLAGAATFAANLEDPRMAAFAIVAPPLISWMILFPFVLYSMLAEDGMLALFSPQVFKSLSMSADAWVIFYAYSIGMLLLLAGAGALLVFSDMPFAAVGGCAVVALLIVYARLLGRLIWYTSQKDSELSLGGRK